jgi:hypothetical protein
MDVWLCLASMAWWRFSTRRKVMKSLLVGTGRYLCKVYNYHDSRACSYKRSGILSRLDGYLDEIGFGESVRLCVNLCFLLDNNLCLLLNNNLCLLLDNNLCLMLDNNICHRWDYVFCWILPSVDIYYLIEILGSSTFNFHLVNRMLIIWESSVGAFPHLTLL